MPRTSSWNALVHRCGFSLDLVDDVDAEVQVDALVAQDVLVLLGDADHLVAPAEREDLREAGVEPHAFEDDVEGDEVAQESLVGPPASRS
jgi:hypothetical protein